MAAAGRSNPAIAPDTMTGTVTSGDRSPYQPPSDSTRLPSSPKRTSPSKAPAERRVGSEQALESGYDGLDLAPLRVFGGRQS